MKIYQYDICDGDKGIIFANSEDEATEIFKRNYNNEVTNELNPLECIIDYIAECPTEPRLIFMYN